METLLQLKPYLRKEWNYQLNSPLNPDNILPQSNKKVWWTCPKGHNYETYVYHRFKGCGCPYCSNKKVLIGFNDLATSNPELIDIWNTKQNESLLTDFTFGSEKKVYWKCSNGHSYLQSIASAVKGARCPYCSGQKVLVGFNDLESIFPNLAKEWNYEKNMKLKPSDFTFGSGRKVWWICEFGHEYQATITNRSKPTQSTGCPYCSNRKILIGFNDLKTTMPHLAKEWDYDLNEKTPEDVTKFSNLKVNWTCELNHKWKTTISNRSSRGDNCPYCSNKKILVGFNDLATTHPDLIKEWDFKKNKTCTPEQVTFGSSNYVWWRCESDHSWQSYIYNRTKGSCCPTCNSEFKTSFPELSLFYYLKFLFPDAENRKQFYFTTQPTEADIWIPSLKLVIEVDGYEFHKNKFTQDSQKNKTFNDKSFNVLRVREIFKDKYLPHFESTDKLFSFDYKFNSHANLAFMISSIIEQISILLKINISLMVDENLLKTDEISIRNLGYYLIKKRSLNSLYPEIAKLWHPSKNGNLTPENISPHSCKRVWWICPKGHEFQTSVHSRIKGSISSCIYCSNQKVLKGFNDLATINPKLATEWNSIKNEKLTASDVTSGSGKKIWWTCPNGHDYQCIVASRNKGSQCPYCLNQKILIGFNDLATTNPKLAAEFHPSKNGNLTPTSIMAGSGKKFWWICSEGHEWEQIVNNRNIRSSSCPHCKRNKSPN